jgi:BlaI family transcriptional regulator, penicillinase repressor
MNQETPRRALSEAELDALKVLWAQGPSPVARVREALVEYGRDWAYTTTKTILDRLEEKGYVRRERGAVAHVYVPQVSAEAVARERLGELRETLFGGRDVPLVRALLDGARLSPDAIAALRDALDALEREAGEE